MRKISLFLVLTAVASAVPAHAADSKYPRPAKLDCVAPEANEQARKFTISDFNTDQPWADNDASDSDGVEADAFTTRLCLNNGCDNSYCYVFFTDDVTALAKGKTASIRGLMNYFNSDTIESADPDANTGLARTVELRCTRGK